MLDNKELENIMSRLENLDDEELAVELLKEFNDKSKNLGKLLMNLDESLNGEQWKTLCDNAQKEVDELVKKIMNL